MIRNPERLYEGCPPGSSQAYKLRLIEHFLLAPLAAAFDFEITSAYRPTIAQAALYALDPKRAARKAKGVSQHVLAEAVDIVPKGDLTECYRWCLEHLRAWQTILEYEKGRPHLIHLSLPSERTEIESKRLLFIDPVTGEPGHFENFTGTFPAVAA